MTPRASAASTRATSAGSSATTARGDQHASVGGRRVLPAADRLREGGARGFQLSPLGEQLPQARLDQLGRPVGGQRLLVVLDGPVAVSHLPVELCEVVQDRSPSGGVRRERLVQYADPLLWRSAPAVGDREVDPRDRVLGEHAERPLVPLHGAGVVAVAHELVPPLAEGERLGVLARFGEAGEPGGLEDRHDGAADQRRPDDDQRPGHPGAHPRWAARTARGRPASRAGAGSVAPSRCCGG